MIDRYSLLQRPLVNYSDSSNYYSVFIKEDMAPLPVGVTLNFLFHFLAFRSWKADPMQPSLG